MLLTAYTIAISVVSAMGIFNAFTAPRLRKQRATNQPKVSLLIPARNEENNIRACLECAAKQTYTNYEIIVYNDLSQDRTKEIIEQCQKRFPVKLINGKNLPEGWGGKNWGCHNLAKEASGEILLFIDADVRIKPQTIESAVAMMQKKQVTMLSCFPVQRTRKLSEKAIIPIIDWLSLSFIPLRLVYTTKGTAVSIAIGQFIMITKQAYKKVGGHEAIKGVVTEDVQLARNLKTSNEKIIAVRSKGLVKCRMYDNFKEAFQGLSRSIFLGGHVKPIPFILSLIGFFMLTLTPLIILFVDQRAIILLIPLLIQRIAVAITARENPLQALLFFPVHAILTIVLCINSLHVTMSNKIIWKGRKLNVSLKS